MLTGGCKGSTLRRVYSCCGWWAFNHIDHQMLCSFWLKKLLKFKMKVYYTDVEAPRTMCSFNFIHIRILLFFTSHSSSNRQVQLLILCLIAFIPLYIWFHATSCQLVKFFHVLFRKFIICSCPLYSKNCCISLQHYFHIKCTKIKIPHI